MNNQTHHSQKPRNRQVAENPTQWNLRFRGALHLRYCRTPPNLPTHCDGCGAKFSMAHGLECKKGGLVIQRHDEIKFELQDLAARALIPSVVRDEPQIYQGLAQRLKDFLHQQTNVVMYSQEYL